MGSRLSGKRRVSRRREWSWRRREAKVHHDPLLLLILNTTTGELVRLSWEAVELRCAARTHTCP